MRIRKIWSTKPLVFPPEHLHLYRALLRECTYLPDPNARVFLRNHVTDRFRRYTPRSPTKLRRGPREQKWRNASLIAIRRPTLLRTAAKALKNLRRANCGHRNVLGKILGMTYGRVGPRRHELIQDLTSVEAPKDSAALSRLLKDRADPRNHNVPTPSPKLLAVLRSQAANKSPHFPRKVLRQWQLVIPEKNKWGRPLPVCRVRNIKRRWYADVLDKVLVPLPAEEWFTLQRRANGEIPFEGPIARRTATSSSELQSSLQAYRRERRISRPHNLTSRFMRRLWERTFAQCPLVTPDPEKPMGWKVEWGEAKKAIPFSLRDAVKTRISSLEEDTAGLFEGVNEFGEIEGGKKQLKRISQLSKPHKLKAKQTLAAGA